MKHILAIVTIMLLSACTTNRQPQANDCDVLHKGNTQAIEKCSNDRRKSFFSFL